MPYAVSLVTPPICLSGSVANATPIHSLPIELLLGIFTLVDEDEIDEGNGEPALSMKNKHWQLGRVCRWWRRIVEGNPSLWTRLDVHLAEAAMLSNPTALLHHTLDMTAGQGLLLFVDFGIEGCEDEASTIIENIMVDLLTILAAHAACWRRVVFTHCNGACWQLLSEKIGSTTLAKLKTLVVNDKSLDEDYDDDEEEEEEDADDSDDDYGDWLPDAPLLERFVANKALLYFGPLLPQLAYLALLGTISNISLAYLLHKSSRLEVLWVKQLASGDDWDSAFDLPLEIPARVTSSSLLHLAIHQNVKDLETVDLPNLRSLIAGEPQLLDSAIPYLESISNLIQFSHPPLTWLALLDCDLAVGNLVGILRLLPLLTTFRIHFGIEVNDDFNGNVDRVLSSLTSALGDVDKKTGAFALVPELKEFRIDFLDLEEVASAYKWAFYTPKVEADFGTRQRRNGFTASCTFHGKLYFGVTLPDDDYRNAAYFPVLHNY